MFVFLDTNIVVYAVENPPIDGLKTISRLTLLRSGGDSFMISDLVRLECLVGPFQSGDNILEMQYRAFFGAGGMQVVPITPGVCDRAALIRATTSFKPMDALHLAAAIEHSAGLFLTHDARLSSFPGLKVEILT